VVKLVKAVTGTVETTVDVAEKITSRARAG